MESERFIKFIPSKEAHTLRIDHPNAFLLLILIAECACRITGEAHIGNYKKAGIETRDKYRTALQILIQRGHIRKVETCRNRKKVTPTETPTETPTYGTKVKLLRSDVCDINLKHDPHRNPQKTPTEIPTNKKVAKATKEKEAKASKKKVPISFNRNTNTFDNLTPEFLDLLRKTYPRKDIDFQLGKMCVWLSDPKRSNRVGTQQFISGWIDRADETIPEQKSAETILTPIKANPALEKLVKRRDQCETKSPSYTQAESPSMPKEEPSLQAVG